MDTNGRVILLGIGFGFEWQKDGYLFFRDGDFCWFGEFGCFGFGAFWKFDGSNGGSGCGSEWGCRSRLSRVGGCIGGSDSACVMIVNGIEMNAVEGGVQVGKRSSGVVDGGVERVLLQVQQ